MEPGYTKLDNSLFDWFLSNYSSFTKREAFILLAIVRNTIGWNRSSGKMSCRFVAKQLGDGISYSNVSETLNGLEKRGLVRVEKSKGGSIVTLSVQTAAPVEPVAEQLPVQGCERSQIRNGGVPKSGTGVFPNQERGCSQIRNASVPKSGTNKYRKTL